MPLPLLALALMAASGLAYEVALTRVFSVASYSEYGYWVISMALAGFAVSGVCLSLFQAALLKRKEAWLAWLPVAALVFAALGFVGVALNPFNALELQHPVLWPSQLLNIGKFYLALFPFFFSVGLYVSLCFVSFGAQVPKLYAWDLAGAGLGALALLACMFWLPPFALILAILPLPALAACISATKSRRMLVILLLAIAEISLGFKNPAKPCEYKPLSFALNTQGSRVIAHWFNPRGDYHLVDDFTERLDIDLSNNASLLGVAGPPSSLGLYQDGSRLAAIPKAGIDDTKYFKAALESFPYTQHPGSALLIGSQGGYKIKEAQDASVKVVVALEPDPELFKLIQSPFLQRRQPLEFLAHSVQKFDLIDVSGDYSGPSQDKLAFSLEALKAYQDALSEEGVVSLGLSIQEFGPYAVKLLESAHALASPGCVLAYRSAWNLRVLIFKKPPAEALRKQLSAFCSQRSFDVVWGPQQPEIYNDLPALGWDSGPEGAGQAQDALAEEAARIFSGQAPQTAADFDLRPATLNRPFFYSTLRLSGLAQIGRHLNLVPREELGSLVNLAVLLQALALAVLVLCLPLLARGRIGLGAPSFLRLALYFSALGLGYLFFEVTLIEKITPYLQDRAFAFSLVLCCMLVFSGLGSAMAERLSLGLALGLVAGWLALAWLGLDRLLFWIWAWPLGLQCLACVAAIAPLAFALGIPFPKGLLAAQNKDGALPWAWSLNGAFSVLASPLAYLAARQLGYEAVAVLAFLVYFLAWLSYPKTGKF